MQVAELRVHGIGRHSAKKLLGGATTRSVGPPNLFASQREGQEEVFGVTWSRLTRTGLAAYQFLLLPFALINLAGFMSTKGKNDSALPAMAVATVGWSVSATWVLYGGLIYWDLPALSRESWHSNAVIAVGALLLALVAFRVVRDLSARRHGQSESLVQRALGVSASSWWVHYACTAVLICFVLWRSAPGDALMAVSVIQLLILITLGGLVRLGGADADKLAMDALFLAASLSHIVGYGLSQAVIALQIGHWRDKYFYYPDGLVSGPSEPGIDGSFVIWATALLLWVSTAIAMGVLGFLRRIPLRVPTIWSAWKERGRKLFPFLLARWAQGVASRPPGRPRTSWLLIFLVGSSSVTDLFVYWIGVGTDIPYLWKLPWLQISIALAFGCAAVGGLFLLSPRIGRPVLAMAFDVIGYFPRRFHPWAPPGYSEKVVRDVTDSVKYLLDEHRAVVLVGHSQGSVIAYSAMKSSSADTASECLLITCGSPLRRLYAHFFPGYFSSPAFSETAERMSSPDSTPLGATWWNFARQSDPIAAPLDVPDSQLIRDLTISETDVEANVPGARPLLHSGYWDDPDLVHVVETIRQASI